MLPEFAGLCGPIFTGVMLKTRFFKKSAYLLKFWSKLHEILGEAYPQTTKILREVRGLPTIRFWRYTLLKIWLFWVKKFFSKNFNFFEIFLKKIEIFMMFYCAHKFLVQKNWYLFSQILPKFQKNLKKLIFWETVKTVLANQFSPTCARTQGLYCCFSGKSFIWLTQKLILKKKFFPTFSAQNDFFGWKSSLNWNWNLTSQFITQFYCF